jgi:hypothetical protein
LSAANITISELAATDDRPSSADGVVHVDFVRRNRKTGGEPGRCGSTDISLTSSRKRAARRPFPGEFDQLAQSLNLFGRRRLIQAWRRVTVPLRTGAVPLPQQF